MPTAVEALAAKIKERENQLVRGADPLTPRQAILDATDVQAKHPDKHLRWVNVRDRQKAESRQMDGYVRLSSDEGGRNIGDELVLMAIPKEKFEAKEAAIKQLNKDRLVAHETEMRQAAEATARQLRDRHGIHLDANRILVTSE